MTDDIEKRISDIGNIIQRKADNISTWQDGHAIMEQEQAIAELREERRGLQEQLDRTPTPAAETMTEAIKLFHDGASEVLIKGENGDYVRMEYTPAAPQDAPETTNDRIISMVKAWDASEFVEGSLPLCVINEIERQADLSDARIAELEAANTLLRAQKMHIINTQTNLSAELATARNEADYLISLMKDAAQKLREAGDAHAVLSQYDKISQMEATADELDAVIEALKKPEGEG